MYTFFQGYFHWKNNICEFISEHWVLLFGPKCKKKKTWQVGENIINFFFTISQKQNFLFVIQIKELFMYNETYKTTFKKSIHIWC